MQARRVAITTAQGGREEDAGNTISKCLREGCGESTVDTETLERSLPKPTTEDRINARLLESLIEAKLSTEFLSKGFVRDAAGMAFRAWRAFLTALLRLELD